MMTRQKRKIEQTDSASAELTREDVPPCKYFLSTGSTLLDLAISNHYPGGVGSGRVTQIIGDNSTAKSVLIKEILGAAQRQGGHATEAESEMTPDFQRSPLFGLDVGDWIEEATAAEAREMSLPEVRSICPNYMYCNPESVEKLFDAYLGGVLQMIGGEYGPKHKKVDPLPKPVAFAVDTLTALPSEAELNRDLDKESFAMEKAKAMSAGFRKYVQEIGDQDVAFIAADQIRQKVGATPFSRQWTTHGGKAMQFYASTRVFLSSAGKLKNKYGVVYGVRVNFKIVKNKIAPPFREGFFYVIFDYGIDNVRSNLEFLKEHQDVEGNPLSVSGKKWEWKDKKISTTGIFGAVAAVEEDEEEGEIEEVVVLVWEKLHETPDRKARKR